MTRKEPSSNPPSSPNHSKPKEQAGLKSWFRLSVSRPKSNHEATSATGATDTLAEQDPHRPIQFAAPRLASLYVTPSERNLYLAAMAELERAPPDLPLWSDPTPSLPPLATQAPFEAAIPDHNGRPVSSVNGTGHRHAPTTRPMSPKLVTSPGVQSLAGGLRLRDEFRLNRVPPRSTRHALLSLTPPASLRFTGFPAAALIAADEAVIENWPLGVTTRSEGKERLLQRGEAREGALWKVELEGRAWKRKGRQELDSIRLILSILTALGVHGWVVVDSIQAGSSKKGCHNLLFSYSPDVFAIPPAFFALSFPLPDRISIISAPSKNTPAIISAVRNAITSSSATSPHSRQPMGATSNTAITASSGASIISWKGDKQRGIKLEGWVHPGVYRFWVGGMRRWVVGGVRKKVIDTLHPSLILGLVNNISALHMTLVSSMPLLPITKGRDILIFSTLPSSGLSYRDAWKPDVSDHQTSRSSSPVLVSPLASVPANLDDARTRRQAVLLDSVRNSPTGAGKGRNAVEIDSAGRRVLPWTSMLDERLPRQAERQASETSGHTRHVSESALHPAPSFNAPSERRRTPSANSERPLITGSAKSSPKPRNMLLKKNSSRRKAGKRSSAQSLQSVRGTQTQLPSAWAPPAGSRGHVEPSTRGTTTPDAERWSMIEVPANVGHLGMSVHEHRQSLDGTHESGDSVYTDAQAQPMQTHQVDRSSLLGLVPGPSAAQATLSSVLPTTHTQPLAEPAPETMLQLGRPMDPSPDPSSDLTHANLVTQDGYAGLPLREGTAARRGLVVQNNEALTSVHGSVGFAGQSVLSLASDRRRQVSGPETASEVGRPSGDVTTSRVGSGVPKEHGQRGSNHLALPTTTENSSSPQEQAHHGIGDLGRMLREPLTQRRAAPLPPAENKATDPRVPTPQPIDVPQPAQGAPASSLTPPEAVTDTTPERGKGLMSRLEVRAKHNTFGRLFRKGSPEESPATAGPAGTTDKPNGNGERAAEGLKAVSEHGKSISTYETAPSQAGSSIGGRGPGAAGSARTKIRLGKQV